jgi:hypothetical protein
LVFSKHQLVPYQSITNNISAQHEKLTFLYRWRLWNQVSLEDQLACWIEVGPRRTPGKKRSLAVQLPVRSCYFAVVEGVFAAVGVQAIAQSSLGTSCGNYTGRADCARIDTNHRNQRRPTCHQMRMTGALGVCA